jgi:hypothetical protein
VFQRNLLKHFVFYFPRDKNYFLRCWLEQRNHNLYVVSSILTIANFLLKKNYTFMNLLISKISTAHVIDILKLEPGFILSDFIHCFFDRLEIRHYVKNSVFILDIVDFAGLTGADVSICVVIYVELEFPASISAVELLLRHFSSSAYLRETQSEALRRVTTSISFKKEVHRISRNHLVSTLPFSAFHGCVSRF